MGIGLKSTPIRRRTVAGGLAALVVGGALFGTALAQSGQPDQLAQTAPAQGQGRRSERDQRFETYLNKLASRLGTDAQTLRRAMIGAQQDLVDEAVAAGRLTAEQGARLKQHIEQSGGRPGLHGPRGGKPAKPGRAGQHGARAAIFTAAQQALGLSAEQLRAELGQGKSLNQIAQQQGKDPAQVKQQLVNALSARLDEAVAAGSVPADRAAQVKQRLAQHVDRLMSRTFGSGERGRPGRPKP